MIIAENEVALWLRVTLIRVMRFAGEIDLDVLATHQSKH